MKEKLENDNIAYKQNNNSESNSLEQEVIRVLYEGINGFVHARFSATVNLPNFTIVQTKTAQIIEGDSQDGGLITAPLKTRLIQRPAGEPSAFFRLTDRLGLTQPCDDIAELAAILVGNKLKYGKAFADPLGELNVGLLLPTIPRPQEKIYDRLPNLVEKVDLPGDSHTFADNRALKLTQYYLDRFQDIVGKKTDRPGYYYEATVWLSNPEKYKEKVGAGRARLSEWRDDHLPGGSGLTLLEIFEKVQRLAESSSAAKILCRAYGVRNSRFSTASGFYDIAGSIGCLEDLLKATKPGERENALQKRFEKIGTEGTNRGQLDREILAAQFQIEKVLGKTGDVIPLSPHQVKEWETTSAFAGEIREFLRSYRGRDRATRLDNFVRSSLIKEPDCQRRIEILTQVRDEVLRRYEFLPKWTAPLLKSYARLIHAERTNDPSDFYQGGDVVRALKALDATRAQLSRGENHPSPLAETPINYHANQRALMKGGLLKDVQSEGDNLTPFQRRLLQLVEKPSEFDEHVKTVLDQQGEQENKMLGLEQAKSTLLAHAMKNEGKLPAALTSLLRKYRFM